MTAEEFPSTTTTAPSRKNLRAPSVFAPSSRQQDRLLAILGDEQLVGKVLVAAMSFGTPIGAPRQAPDHNLIANIRALRRILSRLDELTRNPEPAWRALVDQVTASTPQSPAASFVQALEAGALPSLIAATDKLTETARRQRGRPADPVEREQLMIMMRELASIAQTAGLRITRLSPRFLEIVEIVFDLTYVVNTSPASAVQYLVSERAAAARQGRRRISFG